MVCALQKQWIEAVMTLICVGPRCSSPHCKQTVASDGWHSSAMTSILVVAFERFFPRKSHGKLRSPAPQSERARTEWGPQQGLGRNGSRRARKGPPPRVQDERLKAAPLTGPVRQHRAAVVPVVPSCREQHRERSCLSFGRSSASRICACCRVAVTMA